MSHVLPAESSHHVMLESGHHVLTRVSFVSRQFRGLGLVETVPHFNGGIPVVVPLGPTMTFSPADNAGVSSSGLPYPVSPVPPNAIWPDGTLVTITVPQTTSGSGWNIQRFYGWGGNVPGRDPSLGFFPPLPDPGQTFTASTSYVGSNPVLTFDPNDWLDTSGPVTGSNIIAFYASRYVRITGLDGNPTGYWGSYANEGHFIENTDNNVYDLDGVGHIGTSVGANTLTGPYAIYDWAITGPLGVFFGKIGGPDVLGTYDVLGGGSPLLVSAGGFDP